MKKIDIKKHIIKKNIDEGMDEVHLAGDGQHGQPQSTVKQSDAYRALVEYFKNAQYLVKSEDDDRQLIIKHDKYSKIKITNNGVHRFNIFGVINSEDSLEARIVFDIPMIDKEFKIIASRKKDSNRYACALLSYDNELVYSRCKRA